MKLIRYILGGTILVMTLAASIPIIVLCLWLIDQEHLIVTNKDATS